MPKKISQLREAYPADGTCGEPVSDRPALLESDAFRAAYVAAWDGDRAACAEALRVQDLPGNNLAELLLTAVSEHQVYARDRELADPETIRELDRELEVLRRCRPGTAEDAAAIAKRIGEVETTCAIERDAKARAERAVAYCGSLQSLFPGLFGQPITQRYLDLLLPPRTMAAIQRIAPDVRLNLAHADDWKQWHLAGQRPATETLRLATR
jgi:hypothetical protein